MPKIIVFIGDTHGDLEASRLVVDSYLDKAEKLIWLGDYVDRGKESKENVDFLLNLRKRFPEKVILLMGNHEAYPIIQLIPAEFWEALATEEYEYYSIVFMELPLYFEAGSIIAVHGGLPDVKSLSEMKIKRMASDDNFRKIIWGDFLDEPGEVVGDFFGRPQLGKDYFERVMRRIGKRYLIRGHDPRAPHEMYNGRCKTVFTSKAYNKREVLKVTLKEGKEPVFELEEI